MNDDLVKKALHSFEAGPQFAPMNDFRLMCEEVTRLRALVKEAEYARGKIVPNYEDTDMECSCPWCDSAGLPHKADCRAFTPEGVVR